MTDDMRQGIDLDALRSPAVFGLPDGAPVRVVDTHVSRLLFAGGRVVKVKRALRLPFIDASSLERRRFLCAEEVRLGRRLAPDIYEGVLPITREPDGSLRLGGAGTTVEHAVVMKELPRERLLDHLLEAGAVDNALLDRLARMLVDLEAKAARDAAISAYGAPDALRKTVLENLAELRDLAGEDVLTARRASRLDAYLRDFVEGRRALLERRVREMRVREGHGDLHAGNICDLDGAIVVYDPIEFEPAYRCLDVAAEVAFLAMDLEARGYPAFGAMFVRRAKDALADPDVEALVPFYVAHYALVRAKVALLQGDGARDDAARARARAHVDLASVRLLGPCLVLTCGLPGSGKSTFARALAHAAGFDVLRSDVVRKELFGLAASERRHEPDQQGIYAPEATGRTYAELLARARSILDAGGRVILDAAFGTRAQRAPVFALAGDRSVPFACVLLEAEDAEIRRRLERRAQDPHEASDAGIAVYEQARARFEPPDEFPDARIRTASAAKDAVHRVLEVLLAQTPEG